MEIALISVAVISLISMVFNVGYIIHEMGWYPHTKDRKNPKQAYGILKPDILSQKKISHEHQVMDGWNYDLRKLGHAEIYQVKDPYAALENVITRYRQQPTRSRYDDLVHMSNYVSNKIQSDDRVNKLIDEIAEIIKSQPIKY